MQKVDRLIHAKWIITCEEKNRILIGHALVIKDNKILNILPSNQANLKYQADDEQQYTSHVVMPGFINAHTHIAMNYLRGLADDLDLMSWLTKYIWPAEEKWVSEEFVYDASKLAIAEMIRGGTIGFNDMYFFPAATAKAVEEAGLRAHLGMTVISVPTAFAKTPAEYFEKGISFYEQYATHERIKPVIAPHSTYSVDLDDLVKVKELADRYQLKIDIHLQEAPSEMLNAQQKFNERPLNRLNKIGMVSPNLIAIHMTQLDDNDLELLQDKKPHIVHCPESNMKLVSGFCPVEKLLKLGINVALGTDGAASNNDLDMFGEMRSAAFLGKLAANDPAAVSAEQVLKMATINGAKALGIDHLTGSLEPGKAADFIVINMDQIETQPVYNLISQLVYATPRNQVTDVWVEGKQLLKNRELQTLDEKEILNKAQIWRNKIKN